MDSLLIKDDHDMYSQLHNSYALRFGKYIARILEYEVYPWDDPYTHRNERQILYTMNTSTNERVYTPPNPGSICTFYVHRTKHGRNDPYKRGTYKGIDIVIHGGILIRSILVATPYEDNVKHLSRPDPKYGGTIIEGPCLVVDHICTLTGWSLSELENNLQLIKCKWRITAQYSSTPDMFPIYLGTRVGITMKRAPISDIIHWAKHITLPYRSCAFLPSKGKDTFFVIDNNRKDIPSHTSRYQEEYMQGCYMTSLSSNMTQLQVAGYLSTHSV